MKKNTLLAALLATTVIFSGTAAYAHGNKDGGGKQGQQFEKGGKGGKHNGKRMGKRGGGRGGMMRQHIVKLADTDDDGKVSKEEMQAYKDAQFKKYDADSDGKLSEEEMKTMRDAHRDAAQAARFTSLDTNNDGSISQEELNAGSNGRAKGNK